MAALPLILLVAGTAVTALGAVENADAQRRAANTNADNARNAAAIGIDQGNAQAAIQARQSRAQLDQARATYGASGVDENAGSPVDVLQASVMNASLDNQTIKYNARVKAFGFTNEAASYGTQATASQQAGYIAAGSDILTGGSKVYAARGYSSGGAGSSINTGT